MTTLAIFPLLVLVLLGLGALAAVVYGIVYVVSNKHPRAALTAVLLPIALLSVLGILMAVFPTIRHNHRAPPTMVVSLDHAAPPSLQIRDDVSMIKIGVLGLMVVMVGWWLLRPRTDGRPRGAWARALRLFLIGLVVLGIYMQLSYRPGPTGPVRVKIHTMSEADSAPWHMDEAHRELAAAGKRADENVQQSMQELWEQLNQPRIRVDATQDSSGQVAGSGVVEFSPPPSASDASSDQGDDRSGLANQAKQVARLARVVATVATRVSDVATAVGTELLSADRSESSAAADTADSAEISGPPSEKRRIELTEHVGPSDSAPAGPRPAWVDDPPKRVGTAWREVVATDEFATIDECYDEADERLRWATARHVATVSDEFYDVYDSGTFPPFDDWSSAEWRLGVMGIGIDYIRREIAREEYVETVQRSFGEMKKLYTLVEFTPGVDRELQIRWDAYRRQERLAIVGAGTGAVLGLLGLIFGLLKVDTWTKGYYTKRLFLGVPAAIIGVVLILTTLIAWIDATF